MSTNKQKLLEIRQDILEKETKLKEKTKNFNAIWINLPLGIVSILFGIWFLGILRKEQEGQNVGEVNFWKVFGFWILFAILWMIFVNFFTSSGQNLRKLKKEINILKEEKKKYEKLIYLENRKR